MSEEQPATFDAEILLSIELLIKIVAQGVDAVPRGQLPLAEKCFAAVRKAVDNAAGALDPMLPMALLGQSLVLVKRGQHSQAKVIRDQALARIDEKWRAIPLPLYHYFIALLMQRQQDYRHALPFWELALEFARKETSPMLIAEMLREIGEGYCHIGLTDHAAVPLRAALKILEKTPEHPWRNPTLLTLGNALRKSAPAEAEKYYREAAESHASRLQYVSAAPAWVNLGILCSEQGRYSESLEFYHKVLRIREGDASTPPERIAGLHNNIANCYRRMKSFDEALTSVDHAIALYPADDPKRAYAYSTRAMTLRDAGRDEEAIEWFRRAILERRRQPSPSFEAEADDLQGLIDSLKRLGRESETPAVEQELDALRQDRNLIQATAQTAEEFTAFSAGSVFIEVPIGSHADPVIREEIRRLVYALQGEAMSKGVGRLSGHITIPENRTLIFIGPDAEELFKVIEPLLAACSLFGGAHLTIRQGDTRREVIFPQHPTAVN